MGILDSLKRFLAPPSADIPGRSVVRVDFDYTLMRLDPALEVHVQSGGRPKSWFFEVPDGADADEALREVFRRENARLRRAEPSDPNYFAVLGSKPVPIPFDPSGPYPWESAEIVWEVSNAFVVDRPDRIVPLAPSGFTLHLALRALVAGAIGVAQYRAIAKGRLREDLVEKVVAQPEPFVELGLMMGESGSGWAEDG